MALTVLKKPLKVQPLDADEQSTLPLVEAVDEMLALTAKLEAHDAKVELERKRLAELKATLLAAIDETTPAEDKAVLVGSDGRQLEFSAKGEASTITDLEKAKKLLGTATFMKIAKIGITDLRAYLTPPEFAEVTKTERTGTRRIKIIGDKKPTKKSTKK